ncbi:MAG: 16S rRNA (guanine(966)-N(2))-methyltransferase RsmD [Aeromicrobium sp.]
MTRIIAGTWGGRRLATPKGADTRPTSDRVREAMFSSLESELGGFAGLCVVDLYAGSGALGLEALSRGAGRVDLVESGRPAQRAIAANIAELGTMSARLHRTTAERFLAGCRDRFDLVFVDPPYADDPTAVLAAVSALLAPSGLVVVERSSRTEFAWPEGLTGIRDKAYGETRLWYGRQS